MPRKHNATGRSTTKLRNFTALEHYMLDSPAWCTLLPAAQSAYVAIARLYNGSNNGKLAVSARTLASKLRMSRQTASRMLKELTARGFIEVVKPGGFNLKAGEGRATEWRVTCQRCDVTGALPSKAFMHWQPQKQNAASLQGQSGPMPEPGSAGIGISCQNLALN